MQAVRQSGFNVRAVRPSSLRKTYKPRKAPPPLYDKPEYVDYLHLYRHLLRAASYLPDPVARITTSESIRLRFTRNREKCAVLARKISPKTGQGQEELDTRRRNYFKNGKKELRILLRACNGQQDELQKVLEEAYGRKGKRRRQLVAALVSPDSGMHPYSEELLNKFLRDAGRVHQTLSFSPKLLAFMKSQLINQPLARGGSKLRSIAPKVPNVNVWGRPLPKKLETSIRAKFWRRTLESLLPPISANEWEYLQKLSEGKIPFTGPPPRRRLATQAVATAEIPNDWSDPEFSAFDRWHGSDYRDELGIISKKKKAEYAEYTPDAYLLNSRTMRRLWGNIWASCPKMILDNDMVTWRIVWGTGASKSARGEITQPSPRYSELFEGLENLPESKKSSFRNRDFTARTKPRLASDA